jgi:hypothetical protein
MTDLSNLISAVVAAKMTPEFIERKWTPAWASWWWNPSNRRLQLQRCGQANQDRR